MEATRALADQFEADRQHLRSVAFHLLGSVDDADDAVQGAWLKASSADVQNIQNPTGWLTTITVRESLDQLRARRRRAERPLSDIDTEWDDPGAASADEDVLLADSVSRALLVVLDRLSPAQRVAFVLHDVFAMPFDEIGELLDRSAVAAKKLASRARERLHGSPPPLDTRRTTQHARIVKAFLTAARGGDLPTLLNLLAPDVVRTVDRQLVPDNVATEVRGARQVAEETPLFAHRARSGVVVLVDGVPGIALAPRGRVRAVMRLTMDADDRIHRIEIIGDADRLGTMTLTLVQPGPWSTVK
ncbi:sigma-70 family RNA polymerase sigma factor [Actinopolymorpha alba]|uniref:sigma-70 family RNA polymerase sigma factor n=1 Tax=Actinopolymorpha alba TaxID=533267 RepID=UPI00037C99D6|nr:sigma-70 family RNA polymerase sigma factor [Actinopolymorpha alba]